MIKYYCDICKKEVDHSKVEIFGSVSVHKLREKECSFTETETREIYYDQVCYKCSQSIIEYINSLVIKEEG